MRSSAPTPELDRVAQGAPHVVYEGDDAVYDNAAAVALELLALAGLRATCQAVDACGDDVMTVVVDGVTFSEDIDRSEPLPSIVACINAVLKSHQLDRRLIEFREPGWEADLGVVLVNKTQRDALCDADLPEGYAYDPADPND